jgi:BirA family transcriptional regulator, biotin operon repressor / biotin---[acetyl-CoA-carboxylase] ligase
VVHALTGTPRVIRLSTADSTMDLLHGLAAKGAEAGTVVVAGEQTGGRGSRGRSWHSPPGGLWLSALFRPPAAAGVELFGLRIGLAVAEAVAALGPGVPVDIKWPNDLMLGDRKLGGILCEARWQGESLAWVAAGVGINVANAIPDELAGIAASLADRLPGVTPELIEPEVTARLRALGAPSERLRAAELTGLRQRDWLYGRLLRAPVPGTAAGISHEGALLVRASDGQIVTVRAGTVELADRSLTP